MCLAGAAQNDLQAMARCHRIGQAREVTIYRLVSRDTYEQNVFDCASRKQGAHGCPAPPLMAHALTTRLRTASHALHQRLSLKTESPGIQMGWEAWERAPHKEADVKDSQVQ